MDKINEVTKALTEVEQELTEIEEAIETVEDATSGEYVDMEIGYGMLEELPPVRIKLESKTRFNIAEVLRHREEELLEVHEHQKDKLRRAVTVCLGEEVE